MYCIHAIFTCFIPSYNIIRVSCNSRSCSTNTMSFILLFFPFRVYIDKRFIIHSSSNCIKPYKKYEFRTDPAKQESHVIPTSNLIQRHTNLT